MYSNTRILLLSSKILYYNLCLLKDSRTKYSIIATSKVYKIELLFLFNFSIRILLNR